MSRLAALGLVLSGCVSTTAALVPPRPASVAADALFVEGKALFRDAHCGGTAMTAERGEKLRRPVANVALRLSTGRQNLPAPALAIVQTDAVGRFQAWLPPGTYCVVLSTRSREAGNQPAPPEALAGHPSTPACLQALEARCDGELIVGERQSEVWADLVGKSCAWNSPCAAQIAPAPASSAAP